MSSEVTVSASLLKQAKKERSAYLFILPHFIFFTVFFLIPVVWGIYYSFFNYTLSIFGDSRGM
jgi:multiple sugar transport system permease protein